MKLYAQHGHAAGDKILKGISDGQIEGVIFSPRYMKYENAQDKILEIKAANPDADILLDPEYYATRYVGAPNCQLRYLTEWPHFVPRRRNELLVGSVGIDATLRASYETQLRLGCSALIAPNVFVSNSLDSIEAAIAISFISRSRLVANEMGVDVPVFASVVLGRDALLDRRNYESFLNAITAVEPLPAGVYALIGGGPADERVGTVRSEIIVPEIIAGWMLLNYSLSLNGMKVINGSSDILTPWLGVAGGYAGATGWWSNLQVFAMGRYVRSSGGGQLPRVRYLSKALLNRITINEREAFAAIVPDIMNRLSTDVLYEGREPSRTDEAIQNWDAINSLVRDSTSDEIMRGLGVLKQKTIRARELYDQLQSFGFSEQYEANTEYLDALSGSISAFEELAEI